MSFSSRLKSELCQAKVEGRVAKNALLAGVVFSIGREEDDVISVGTEASDVVKLVLKLVKSGFGRDVVLSADENSPFSKKKIYEIRFKKSEKLEHEVLRKISPDNAMYEFEDSVDYFIRGVFLGVGSVTNPTRGYHLEFPFKEAWRADCIHKILTYHYELSNKVLPRKNSYVCYLKGAENIANFLTIIGSVSTFFEFEDARVLKQVTNNINRIMNCDIANINKITDAAKVQMEAIHLLKEAGVLRKMGDKYVEIAELRLEYPELSIGGLAEFTDPPITKSGCNHRFNKIMEEARKIKGEQSN